MIIFCDYFLFWPKLKLFHFISNCFPTFSIVVLIRRVYISMGEISFNLFNPDANANNLLAYKMI